MGTPGASPLPQAAGTPLGAIAKAPAKKQTNSKTTDGFFSSSSESEFESSSDENQASQLLLQSGTSQSAESS